MERGKREGRDNREFVKLRDTHLRNVCLTAVIEFDPKLTYVQQRSRLVVPECYGCGTCFLFHSQKPLRERR